MKAIYKRVMAVMVLAILACANPLVATPTPEPIAMIVSTSTPQPTYTPTPTFTPLPTATDTPMPTPTEVLFAWGDDPIGADIQAVEDFWHLYNRSFFMVESDTFLWWPSRTDPKIAIGFIVEDCKVVEVFVMIAEEISVEEYSHIEYILSGFGLYDLWKDKLDYTEPMGGWLTFTFR